MALQPGQKLGPYEITGSLGAGGMGEVYRADDTRLGRSVAIKVLPEHMAANPELKQRLEREARAISSLSHPNICALYDIGHQDGIDFLVMEHIEGETLAARLLRGPLSREEFFPLAIQIADALDKAHRSGIIHRDLKPGNVMLTKEGAKLLDFGLAKAEMPITSGTTTDGTATPTVSKALTVEGTILGTYQYMAPEQLEGREADVRSDLFALGCVLFEMATGQPAFGGQSQAALIGSIMHAQPASVSTLQPMASPALDRVIQVCLSKDPEDRWQTAHDVLLQLRWIEEGGSVTGVPAPVASRRKTRERLAWGLFAAAAVAAAAFAAAFVAKAPASSQPVTKFFIAPEEEIAALGSPRISPDGLTIAFDAIDSTGRNMIWVRPLDALVARALPGTEGAGRPFWSPDSRFIGFFSGGKLKKVDIVGAPPQVLCDSGTGADGSWSKSGWILYDGRAEDPIRIVPATGGVPRPLIVKNTDETVGPYEVAVGWPEFLPDGEHFLYQSMQPDRNVLMIGSVEEGFEPVTLFETETRVAFAAPGHLMYVRDQTLVAQAFDPEELEIKGEPIPLAQDLEIGVAGLAHFSTSNNGSLIYRAGETGLARLVWLDRDGRELEELDEPAEYRMAVLSPDGKRAAIQIVPQGSGASDIWIRDLARGVNSRFTFDPADDASPVWSSDGSQIYFHSSRNDAIGVFRKPSSGVGQPELVYTAEGALFLNDIAPDDSALLLMRRTEETGWDIWAVPLAEDGVAGEATPFIQTPFGEFRPSFSPDGGWVVYQSMESGTSEIYVQQFPGPGGKWQISNSGGSEPSWSRDGKSVYYLGTDGQFYGVAVDAGATLTAGRPEAMFLAAAHPAITRSHFSFTPDGERLLMLRSMSREAVAPTTVVTNWPATLRR